MKVNVAQVRRNENGSARFDLAEDFSQYQGELEEGSFNTPVSLSLQVNNTGKSLVVNGTITTELSVRCGRCLKEFIYPIELNYEDEWVPSAKATEEQLENSLVFDKDEIELDERILEQIVLALPMRFICSEDCKGLCPICGINKNIGPCDCVQDDIDPRLAALAQWSRETGKNN